MVIKKEDGNSKETGKKESEKVLGNEASPSKPDSSANTSETGKGKASTSPKKATGKSQAGSAVRKDAKKGAKTAVKAADKPSATAAQPSPANNGEKGTPTTRKKAESAAKKEPPASDNSKQPSEKASPTAEASRPVVKEKAAESAAKKEPPASDNSKQPSEKASPTAEAARPVVEEQAAESAPMELPRTLTVRELAESLEVSPIDVIKELMANGIIANINQQLDYETAAIVAEELGFATVERQEVVEQTSDEDGLVTIWQQICDTESPENMRPRPPVVTVMGHVDHGKTSLLDVIRHTDVAGDEAGGITQRIGAYQVEAQGKRITFLDTPGHEAFTAMRARGALATDVAVLVVAADDGVMPQTKEAIAHARAARVPIIIALNKIDKPNANQDLVKQQLADLALQCEEWGGDVICVPISAKNKTGIDELLENILLVAEVNNLRANPNCPAIGTVIEGQLDRQRGAVATVLVQNGTLVVGDVFTVGRVSGRIRAMLDDKGRAVKEAPPSMPVMIMGLREVPSAGDLLEVVANEHQAREIVAQRRETEREQAAPGVHRPVNLDEIFAEIQAGKVKELHLILKADAQGSIEPIQRSLDKLEYENLRVKFVHVGTGNVSESDVALAVASNAVVLAFAVVVDAAARRLADTEGIDIRSYNIIYKLIEDIDKALRGMLEPVYEDVALGRAEVRALFRIPKKGTIAGAQVITGKALRNAKVRVIRGSEVLHDGKVVSLRRFTEDVQEVNTGFECGVGVDGFNDLAEGDILEFYRTERVS